MTKLHRRLAIAFALLLCAGALVSWRWRAAPAASVTAVAAPDSVVELTPDDLVTAHVGALARTVSLTGSLKAVRSAVLKAKVAGELLSLAPREGDSVRALEVVGRIDATELDWRVRQAEQQAAAAQAQRDITLRQLENSRALVQQGYVSPTTLDTALGTDQAALATWQAAQAALELARKAQADAVLRAPLSGQVSQRLAQPGERLAVDGRILEIVDLSALELEAAVAAEDSAALVPGTQARLTVEGVAQPVPAKVARVNPATQPGTRSVLVYLAVQGAPGLRAGLFAQGEALLEHRQALVLPLAAVRTDEAQPHVIVLRDGRLHHVTVRTGTRGLAEGLQVVELLEGVREGDRILRATVGSVPDGTRARLGSTSPAPPAASS